MEAFWIWLLPLYDRLREILAAGTIGELKQITCQYGFVASGARKDRKFDSGLGGGALLDIGIYNLGFLRILTGQDPEKVETKEVHINEYGTDDYSRLALTYPGGCKAESVQTIGQELERNARIVGTKGSIFLPDFQHAETMTLEVEAKSRRSSAARWTSTALSMRSGKQAAASNWGAPAATATPRRTALP